MNFEAPTFEEQPTEEVKEEVERYEQNNQEPQSTDQSVSRRGFLRGVAGIAAAFAGIKASESLAGGRRDDIDSSGENKEAQYESLDIQRMRKIMDNALIRAKAEKVKGSIAEEKFPPSGRKFSGETVQGKRVVGFSVTPVAGGPYWGGGDVGGGSVDMNKIYEHCAKNLPKGKWRGIFEQGPVGGSPEATLVFVEKTEEKK